MTFSFNSTAQPEDFLNDNRLVIYGHWQSSFALKSKLKYRQFLQAQFGKPIQPKHMIAQMLGADILGFKSSLKFTIIRILSIVMP